MASRSSPSERNVWLPPSQVGHVLHGDGVLDDVGLVAVGPDLGECALARPLALFAWGMG